MSINVEVRPGGARALDGWELVERARGGDQQAFSALYLQHFDDILGFVFLRTQDRTLAEEIASETFLRALRQLKSLAYRGKPVRAWLTTVARNLIIDDARSARRQREILFAEHFDTASPAADPAAVVCARLDAAKLRDHMRQLTDDQRHCLYLRFFEHLTVAEVAKIMHRTDEAVRALQIRAVRQLRSIFTATDG